MHLGCFLNQSETPINSLFRFVNYQGRFILILSLNFSFRSAPILDSLKKTRHCSIQLCKDNLFVKYDIDLTPLIFSKTVSTILITGGNSKGCLDPQKIKKRRNKRSAYRYKSNSSLIGGSFF
jgi:hypothetical protein